MERVIVTRHPALKDLLIEKGLVNKETKTLVHATEEDVKNKRVYGVLPLSLAAEADSITEITLSLTPEDRGKELSLERLKEIEKGITTYVVSKLSK